MDDVHAYKQETIRAFDELFKGCSEAENNVTDEELPINLAFGFGVYTAACSVMGEDCAKKLSDLHPLYASEENINRLRPKLRLVK
tara:strand:+ start:321 stop:575 length:255 start_codon:yes stop_codon:yes gene_type:complete